MANYVIQVELEEKKLWKNKKNTILYALTDVTWADAYEFMTRLTEQHNKNLSRIWFGSDNPIHGFSDEQIQILKREFPQIFGAPTATVDPKMKAFLEFLDELEKSLGKN